MKNIYKIEESINGTDIYCGVYSPNYVDNQPFDMIHTPNLEEVFAFIRKLEGVEEIHTCYICNHPVESEVNFLRPDLYQADTNGDYSEHYICKNCHEAARDEI
jgi:hypothetical protein